MKTNNALNEYWTGYLDTKHLINSDGIDYAYHRITQLPYNNAYYKGCLYAIKVAARKAYE